VSGKVCSTNLGGWPETCDDLTDATHDIFTHQLFVGLWRHVREEVLDFMMQPVKHIVQMHTDN